MKVDSIEKYRELVDKYLSVISKQYFDLLEDFLLGTKKSIDIPDSEIELWKSKLKKRIEAEELLSRTAQRNNLGIEAEKNGQLEKAIEYYEENIKDGYQAIHSFDRLMILYHRRKQYKDEIRVIDLAVEIFNTDSYNETAAKWIVRKEKANKLLSKWENQKVH